MGNHDVGRAMASGAELFWQLKGDASPTKDEALKALDALAFRWRGADAEFDDELMDGTSSALGKLVALAFDATPEEAAAADDDNGGNPWYDGPYQRFRDRYKFC